jgi:hypothetical protein
MNANAIYAVDLTVCGVHCCSFLVDLTVCGVRCCAFVVDLTVCGVHCCAFVNAIIEVFRSGADNVSDLEGCNAASWGIWFATFRDSATVSFSRFIPLKVSKRRVPCTL